MRFESLFKLTAIILSSGCLFTQAAVARSIYLNGIDISSSRNQTLKKVNLRIDENGNLYIEAPHYQVDEQQSYTPLSSWVQGINAPRHKKPGKLAGERTISSQSDMAKAGSKNEAPIPNEDPMTAPIEKPATDNDAIQKKKL